MVTYVMESDVPIGWWHRPPWEGVGVPHCLAVEVPPLQSAGLLVNVVKDVVPANPEEV